MSPAKTDERSRCRLGGPKETCIKWGPVSRKEKVQFWRGEPCGVAMGVAAVRVIRGGADGHGETSARPRRDPGGAGRRRRTAGRTLGPAYDWARRRLC